MSLRSTVAIRWILPDFLGTLDAGPPPPPRSAWSSSPASQGTNRKRRALILPRLRGRGTAEGGGGGGSSSNETSLLRFDQAAHEPALHQHDHQDGRHDRQHAGDHDE